MRRMCFCSNKVRSWFFFSFGIGYSLLLPARCFVLCYKSNVDKLSTVGQRYMCCVCVMCSFACCYHFVEANRMVGGGLSALLAGFLCFPNSGCKVMPFFVP